jgi:hypothetical protein
VAVAVCVSVYGASVCLFGFARSLWVGVAMLAVSGAADMVSSAYRSTILQVAAPDNLRGRLQGVFTVVVAGGPRMGDFLAGSTASLTTPTIALAGGGIACILGVVVASWWQRGFLAYDSADPVA